MSVTRAFLTGFRRASSQPKMLLVLYLVNLLMSIPLALALHSVLESGLGGSLASSQLLGGLDFTVWQDFTVAHQGELSAVFSQIVWVVLVSLFVQTFLAGGILARVCNPEGSFSASAFFGGCGNYFFRFLRLFLIFAIVVCVDGAVVGLLVGTLEDALTKHALSEVTDLWVKIGGAVLFLIPLVVVLMVADYARVRTVVEDERSMWRCAGRAAKFVLGRLRKTFALQVALLLVALFLFAIYLWLDLAIGMTTTATIVLMMIIQQLFMVSRSWMRVATYASELTLYDGLRPTVAEPVGNVGHEQNVEPSGAA